ncbi:ATP-binding cassette, subfamily B, MsbA [Verrucomicrobium sp. GAS474]|uniref:ABC transporter ATP-binding protein n=1 Tax=Verrucomicrobium sp. GAS474 TaxID=1882831 RepID=UPI00087A809C|nr:ABC transporter ATP-binding protein [Verrucomicrobium sp. GAS474]SDU10397.1 ATP-binding cassette, subfamily B, MsbA [Verrucomicrobium sp. GAS474]
MNEIRRIFGFLKPWLLPYRERQVAGIVFGILFGLSNGLIIGAIKVVGAHLSADPSAGPALASGQGFLDHAQAWLDAWIPKIGAPLDWRQTTGVLLFLPVLAGIRGLFSYLSSYCISWVGENVTNDLRVAVMRKLGGLSLDYFDRAKMGDMMTRVQGDTAAIQNCLDRGVSDGIKEPFTILFVLGGLLWADWRLTLISLVLIPLCIIPVRILGKKVRRANQGTIGQTVLQSSLLVESLGAIRVVKAFGLEETQAARFAGHSSELKRFNLKRVQARQLVNPIIEVISMFGLGVLLLYIFSEKVPVANIIAFLFGVVAFQNSFKKIALLHVIVKEVGVAISRLEEVLQMEPTVREKAEPVRLPEFGRGLSLRGVRFGYGEAEILKGLDLEIPKGTRLGIAGESGSGKSTLLNLLLRFYDPTAGAVSLDGIDLRDASMRDLRARIGLVSQEAVLFDMTVAGNIACGRSGSPATRAEVEEAARAAHAHDFILGLPQGYETQIGERGVRLSGGQRARLAIARAFIRNAPILILDEPTAALDAEAEREVQKALERLSENRTVICVAHRLATLRAMDRVIVLSQGRLIEEGSFDALLAQGGTFARMAAQQGIRA